MVRRLKLVIVVGVLLHAVPVRGEEVRAALPSASGRQAADIASWGTALTAVGFDTNASWDCADRAHCFQMQGIRIGVTYGVVWIAKRVVGRDRPCAPECGIDNPHSSFYSAHTALAFQTIGGPRLSVSLPLAISTGGLRVMAGKHWITDTLVGAAAGLLTSRIR